MSELQRVLSEDIAAVEPETLGLDDGQLVRMYQAMASARALDQRATRLHGDGVVPFYIPSSGLEAIAVGAASALHDGDWLFPSHRDLGMYLLRGGSMRSWLDQLFGNDADLTKGRQLPGHHSLPDGRFVSVSGPIGTQAVQAAGCAVAMKARSDASCALAVFGEAALGGAAVSGALDVAGRSRAPVVFVCRSRPRAGTAAVGVTGSMVARATAFGVTGRRVDGTDVLAVYQAAQEARQGAVQGAGPTLIEAVLDGPSLLAAGDGSPDPAADPVHRLRDFLEQTSVWDAAREEELAKGLSERVDEALGAARQHEKPAPRSLFTDVFAQAPWMLQEQRQQALGEEDE